MKQESSLLQSASGTTDREAGAANGTMHAPRGSAVAREFHSFISDVEDLIASATSLTGEDLAQARAKLVSRIAAAKVTVGDVGESVTTRIRSGARATDSFVRGQPWQAVGIGALAGALLGYVLGRGKS